MAIIEDLLKAKGVSYSNDFALTDNISCDSCKDDQLPKGIRCNREIMNVHPLESITVLPLDPWFKNLPQTSKTGIKNCDYLLCDTDEILGRKRVALCDLTCSDSAYIEPGKSLKYPQGKRSYAISQMISTAKFFLDTDVLGFQIAIATERDMIFGVRSFDTVNNGIVESALSGFTRTPSQMAETIRSEQYVDGCKFFYIEVKYPTALAW